MAITKVIVISAETQKAQKALKEVNMTLEQQEDLLKDIQRQIEKLEDLRDKTSSKDLNKIKKYNDEIAIQNKNLKRTKTRIQENKQARTKETKAIKESVKEQREYTGVLGLIDKMTGGAVSAFQRFTQGIGSATKGMKLLRIAWIATGIGAFVVVITSLIAAFTQSEEGQEKLQRGLKMMGAVVKQIIDTYAKFGKAIIDAFSNPMESLKSLGKGIKNFLLNPFKSIKEAVIGAKEGIKDFIKETVEEVNVIGKVTAARQKAHRLERALIVERAEANQKINKIRLDAEDRENKTSTERVKLLKEAQQIEEEITNKQIKAKKLLVDAQKLEMAQGLNNIATKDNLAKLEAELINLTTQKHRSQRLLQTQITTAAREEITQLKAVQTFKDGMILKDEDNRYQAIEKQKADRLIELEELLVSETEKQQLKLDIEQNFKDQKKIIDDEAKILEEEEKAALLEKVNEDEILKLEKQKEKDLAELERLKGTEEEKNKIIAFYAKKIKKVEDKEAKEKKERDEAVGKAKIAIAMRSMALIGEIAGKGSAIGKAMAVGQATISGIEGVQNAFTTANKSPITAGFPAYPYIQASLAGVFSALQIRKILSTKADGKGATPSPIVSGGGAPQVAPPLPPSFNTVGTSGTNQLADAIGGQAPARAYVVSGDITTAQGLERNTIEGATI